jgi:tetratricopeptide (TPR) repeat protein
LQDTIPALLFLLEALPEDSPFHTLDPPQRRQHALQALKRVLLRESQVQPLLLVFEDLHWIDAETQALLDSLVESLPTARLLLLVNYRPEYQHGWGSKTYYTQLRLDPLPSASAEEFLAALLGDDASLEPLKQLLMARTEGNPFFLEESIRTLVEAGVLAGEPGAYRLAQHALRGEVWNKAVIYCQQAGERAWDRAAYREVVAYREQALQALAYLPEDSDTSVRSIDLRIMLTGPLTAMGEPERCLVLLGEAEALARALNDRTRLVRVLAQIGHTYGITGDTDGAVVAGRQALELVAELDDRLLQIRAAYFLGSTYYDVGDFSRAAELQRWAVEAAHRESDRLSPEVRHGPRARLARTLSALGVFAEGRRHGEEALRLATRDGRGQTLVIAHACLGDLYLTQGDLEHATRVLEQGLALCRASDDRSWLAGIAADLGFAYALQGHLAEGYALLEEALSDNILKGGLQTHRRRGVAHLSEVCRRTGRGEEAEQYARRALDLARQQKARGDKALALHQLGVVHAHADPLDVVPAEANYRQALALAEALGMRPLQAHCHRGLGMLYATLGQRQQARTALATALELYQAMEMTFWLPQTKAALAQVEG